jgi:hypothetical protein
MCRPQVITVKNKYLILNNTGLAIEYKQKGTPDPSVTAAYGAGQRFSSTLRNNWRAAWHWDDADKEQEMMIRPAGDEWEWSGEDGRGRAFAWAARSKHSSIRSPDGFARRPLPCARTGGFKLPESEKYFGLRIRHKNRREYVIIPVNITVGAAGSVLVTFKSKE